ncbi:PE domain-containing protein [Actinokineospora sp.]|uniref:PE domain-containing protein n=1 Tax=Actinokineospora sp. TaxID=1872133 RepID=UPI003D6B126B
MRVEPDKILALKRRFEDRREIVREFIDLKRDALVSVRPPGTDPCSEKTVAALGENGASALDAARGYINELTAVIDSLSEAARTYGLVEDNNAQAFQQVQR